ncbi:hypothetical protein MMC09_003930 [Bachmanniomyces sp. S44760]|nr:hypothetical protein [Bachmanniomyces sp. S44760]
MDTCEKFPEVTQLRLLREQDFGYYEGKHFYTRPRDMNKTGKDSHRTQYIDEPGFKDVESKESMTTRMDSFLDEYLIPRLHGSTANKPNIAIVSHGIILSVLWRCLLKRFPAQSVALAPGLTIRGTGETTPLQYLGGWSNTGYLELVLYQEVTCQTPTSEPGSAPASAAVSFDRTEDPANITAKPKSFAISGWRMFIRTVNGKNHLRGLKRTGGGVGSSKHDEGQRKIESFFKKQKIG